ncbi:hypothetical protein ACLB2K_053408 [Fragaria x ananassa]
MNIEYEIGGIQRVSSDYGLSSVKSNLVGSHPVEHAHQSTKKMQEVTNSYGTAFPVRMDLERQMRLNTSAASEVYSFIVSADHETDPPQPSPLVLHLET